MIVHKSDRMSPDGTSYWRVCTETTLRGPTLRREPRARWGEALGRWLGDPAEANLAPCCWRAEGALCGSWGDVLHSSMKATGREVRPDNTGCRSL